LIVGGIVFRVVTPNHPGCPKLDKAGAPAIRTEYLASFKEPWAWCLEEKDAHFFTHHLDAVNTAKLIGTRCHPGVAYPPESERVLIPERLQPLPQPVAPIVPFVNREIRPRKAKKLRKKVAVTAVRQIPDEERFWWKKGAMA
jgi:hypothetical protein